MRVTDIATRAGVGAHTVRYYVRAGLITPTRNPSNNYKRFREEDVVRLRFIKAVQALGFSLAEVQDMLAMMDQGGWPCAYLHERLADKLLEARDEMHALARRIELMQSIHDDWSDASPDGRGVGELCRELEARALEKDVPEERSGGGEATSTIPRSNQPANHATMCASGYAARVRSRAADRETQRKEVAVALSLLDKRWPSADLG